MNNNQKKGVYAPNYYKDFQCIANQCKHSCCIDWEICIDEDTLAKYKNHPQIMGTVVQSDEDMCFALTQDGKCPHLNENGLCNIILSYGEDYLSEICANHPRFYNQTANGTEVGLGIVCEEACRIILEAEKPFSLCALQQECDSDACESDFNAIPYRDFILSLIESGDFTQTTAKLTDKFSIPNVEITDQWIDRFLSFEMLNADWHKTLQSAKGKCNPTDNKHDKYYKRLLTYFVYRHVSVAEDLDVLRSRLAFCLLSVKMIQYLFENETDQSLASLIDIARRYSAEIEYSEDNTYELIFYFQNI